MSKVRNAFFMLLIAALWTVGAAMGVMSQDMTEVTIKVEPATATVRVNSRFAAHGTSGKTKELSFLKSGIGTTDLANRISGLMLADRYGTPVKYRASGPGKFAAETDFYQWNYEVMAAAPANSRSSAHVSWLTDTTGILMLDDIMPQSLSSGAKVKIEIPDGWSIATSEKTVGPNTFETSNVEKAVFVVGKELRQIRINAGNSELNVVRSGEWFFGDGELEAIARSIFEEYQKVFGSGPAKNLQIAVLPFPQKDIQKGTWEAETRGNNVTVVSADMPFKSQSPQRLHEQLRHEIFHFWLPNGINLTGNYDWFYEGFALYQSLKTGVALNKIRFEDFLDTLSRAHNIDSAQSTRLSLIAASQNRWNGGDTHVYARGMATAFLIDLALLQNSKGRNSVSDIFQKLYTSHRPGSPASDANTAIFKILQTEPALAEIIELYIKGPQKIEWQIRLAGAGIENEPGNSRTNLRVMTKLNGRQKALLGKLGYNNWRKLTRK